MKVLFFHECNKSIIIEVALVVCISFLASVVVVAVQGYAEKDSVIVSAVSKALRYGIADLSEAAKDPGRPLAGFITEGLNNRQPAPSIWADVSCRYIEPGYHADAWAIQKAMLTGFVSGALPLTDGAGAPSEGYSGAAGLVPKVDRHGDGSILPFR